MDNNGNNMIDQRKILFWKNSVCCDNMVIRILATISRYNIGQTLSKYFIPSINVDTTEIKHQLWKHFVDLSSSSGKIVFF